MDLNLQDVCRCVGTGSLVGWWICQEDVFDMVTTHTHTHTHALNDNTV
jgi:hypothetical protein